MKSNALQVCSPDTAGFKGINNKKHNRNMNLGKTALNCRHFQGRGVKRFARQGRGVITSLPPLPNLHKRQNVNSFDT